MSPRGMVYIVGAGPGDPELITVKGLRVLREAEVLLYDHLVSEELLKEAPISAERIYVGKRAGHHSFKQEEINALLFEKAREGRRVVRLKGGDPFVFGRAGEEMEFLESKGIPFEVVPGVTAASALASQAKFSLTHRAHSSILTFVTGHRKGDAPLDLPFSALARLGGTVVIYMGLGTLGELQKGLLEEGMEPDTPVLMGRNVTLPTQQFLSTTLGEMVSVREKVGLKPPVLVVIGKVAAGARCMGEGS